MSRFFFSSRRRHTRYWRDWSSDVCSSDLGAVTGLLVAGLALLGVAGYYGVLLLTGEEEREAIDALVGLGFGGSLISEIGRASCRGRVEISVVAVSLKKTTTVGFPTCITEI